MSQVMNWTSLFKEFTATSGLNCIEIYTPNCGPCKFQSRVTEQLCEVYAPSITFARIDGSKRDDLMQEWEVRAVPMFLIFNDDKLVAKFLGPEKFDCIAAKIEELRTLRREAA